jgi:hypothetical protein
VEFSFKNLGDEYDQVGVNGRRDVTLASLEFYLCTLRFFYLGYIIFRSRY